MTGKARMPPDEVGIEAHRWANNLEREESRYQDLLPQDLEYISAKGRRHSDGFRHQRTDAGAAGRLTTKRSGSSIPISSRLPETYHYHHLVAARDASAGEFGVLWVAVRRMWITGVCQRMVSDTRLSSNCNGAHLWSSSRDSPARRSGHRSSSCGVVSLPLTISRPNVPMNR